MKTKQKQEITCQILFLGILFIVTTIVHRHMNMNFGDAIDAYGGILVRGETDVFPQNGNLLSAYVNFTVLHYKEWSSRSIIELILISLCAIPPIYWHILDIAIVVLGGYSFLRLFDMDKQKNIYLYVILFTMLMMYPINHMETAGWIATTVNYSWVLALGLYALTIVKDIWRGENVSKVRYSFALLAAVYAMNQEQMVVILLVIIGTLLITALYEKKDYKKLLPFVILNVAEFVYIATCPGNAVRRKFETGYYFKEYAEYNLLDKAYLGFSTTMNQFLHTLDLVTVVFFIVLAVCVCRSREKYIWKAISVVPVLYVLFRHGLKACRVFYGLFDANPVFTNCVEGRLKDMHGAGIISFLTAAIIALCVGVSCWNALKREKMWILYLLVMLVGVASRIMLGFSASIYASGDRTMLFLYFGFIFTTIHLIKNNQEKFDFLYNRWWMSGLMVLSVILIWTNYRSMY